MPRAIAIAVVLSAAAVVAVIDGGPKPAVAGSGVSVTGRLHLGDAAVLLDARAGHGPRRHDGAGPRHRRRGHVEHDRGRRPLLVLPYYGYADPDERVIVRETVIAPPAPVAEVPAPPPQPLDPRGNARTLSARGTVRLREWVLGDVLPDDMPHVSLDADFVRAAAAAGRPDLRPGRWRRAAHRRRHASDSRRRRPLNREIASGRRPGRAVMHLVYQIGVPA